MGPECAESRATRRTAPPTSRKAAHLTYLKTMIPAKAGSAGAGAPPRRGSPSATSGVSHTLESPCASPMTLSAGTWSKGCASGGRADAFRPGASGRMLMSPRSGLSEVVMFPLIAARRLAFATAGFLCAHRARRRDVPARARRGPRAARAGDRAGLGRVAGIATRERRRPAAAVHDRDARHPRGDQGTGAGGLLGPPAGRPGRRHGRRAFPGRPPSPAARRSCSFSSARRPRRAGMYRLTEFGLSKFDLVTDDDGRRFAMRSAFGPREDVARRRSRRRPRRPRREVGGPGARRRVVPRGALGDRRGPGARRDRVAREVPEGGAASQVGQHRRTRARRLRRRPVSLPLVLGQRAPRPTASSSSPERRPT